MNVFDLHTYHRILNFENIKFILTFCQVSYKYFPFKVLAAMTLPYIETAKVHFQTTTQQNPKVIGHQLTFFHVGRHVSYDTKS